MSRSVLRLLVFSTLGIIAFFVPLTIGGKTTILLDHIVTFLTTDMKKLSHGITFGFLLAGGVLPLVNSDWRKGPLELILVVLKFLAIPIGALYLLGSGPAFLMAPDLVPFLFEKLVMPVGLIVPIGAIFLSFLVGYGLLEFVGVLLEPIMRPIWKIPGRAAIDAVASFTGSYSVGLLITNRVYKEGKYSAKEAAIIATGFSTVSATFMLIVAKTLGLMGIWNFYFWSTLLITFAVSAVSVRLWPLTKLSTAVQTPLEPADQGTSILRQAYLEGLSTAESAPGLWTNLKSNFFDGIKMSINIAPSLLTVGLAGLLLAKYTPIFTWIGYLLYPVIYIMEVPEALLASKAIATGFAEMFLPALYSADAPYFTRYVIGVTSVSSILFLSGSIPCIMSTEIPISVGKLAIIWFQRTVLSIIFAATVAHLMI